MAALRLAASLIVSLLMWLPTVPGALTAHEDPAHLAGRYLLALLIARIGVGVVFRIVKAYTPEPVEEVEEQPEAEPESSDESSVFGRRRDDAAPPLSDQALLDEALDEVEDTTALVQ